MTKEERDFIENQIEQHRAIIWDLADEIEYHEREIENLLSLLENNRKYEN